LAGRIDESSAVVRARVPLRLSFGGGGTDVDPYASLFGGVTLNATIAKYVYCSVESADKLEVEIVNWDLLSRSSHDYRGSAGDQKLVEAVLKRLAPNMSRGLRLRLMSEAIPGSGLGSSSSMVVAVILSLARFFGTAISPAEVAALAYQVERSDLGVSGGYQDQYAAAFGGFNWTEYTAQGVNVVPLSLVPGRINDLQLRLMLWHTGKTHLSGGILQQQIQSYEVGELSTFERLAAMKDHAAAMREAVQAGRLDDFGFLLHESWLLKRRLASNITDAYIDELYEGARGAGALGGKLVGAGGGGFLLLYVPEASRPEVIRALTGIGGQYGGSAYFDLAGPSVWTSPAFVGRIRAFVF
jgi:D-glycero-alpha-D-manno-heptose-7-phosphate kinase